MIIIKLTRHPLYSKWAIQRIKVKEKSRFGINGLKIKFIPKQQTDTHMQDSQGVRFIDTIALFCIQYGQDLK